MPRPILTATSALAAIFCMTLAPQGLAAAPQRASGAAAPPSATAPWVAIEVLVFRRVTRAAGRHETWPARVPAPAAGDAVYPPAAGTGAYSALARSIPLIAEAAAPLRASNRYAIVTALGWRQPAQSSRKVRFSPPPASSAAAAGAQPGNASGARRGAPRVPLAVQVTGTARLLPMGEPAYVILRLRLCQPARPGLAIRTPAMATLDPPRALPGPATSAAARPARVTAQAKQCFALNQRHPVVPGRLTYFDNPIFGALVGMRKIEPPKSIKTPR